jgi:RNA polymerase sigma factor (sigma-70 family)
MCDLATAYSLYAGELFRYAVARGFRSDDAEDVVSEVFMSALRSSYAEFGEIRAWLFCILRSRMVDQRRQWGRRPTVPMGDGYDVSDEGIEDRITGTITIAQWLCSELKPKQTAVIWLFYVEDRTINEVARCTQLSPRAVKAVLYRARQRLSQSPTWNSVRG